MRWPVEKKIFLCVLIPGSLEKISLEDGRQRPVQRTGCLLCHREAYTMLFTRACTARVLESRAIRVRVFANALTKMCSPAPEHHGRLRVLGLFTPGPRRVPPILAKLPLR